MKITIQQELSVENFESVIVGALEGGSRKWAFVDQKNFVKSLPKTAKFFLGDNERIAHALFTNPSLRLPVYDAKDPERQEGYVTQGSMRRAFELVSSLYPTVWNRFQQGEHTPADTDIFFQIAALGEVRFD